MMCVRLIFTTRSFDRQLNHWLAAFRADSIRPARDSIILNERATFRGSRTSVTCAIFLKARALAFHEGLTRFALCNSNNLVAKSPPNRDVGTVKSTSGENVNMGNEFERRSPIPL